MTLKKRIIVTGLNGLIGWNFFLSLQKDYEVYGTYRKPHASFKGSQFFRIDIKETRKMEEFFSSVDPHYILHAWSMCDLDICEEFPELPDRINIKATKEILDIAAELPQLKKFAYMSTEHVFSGEKGSYVEEDAVCPKHVYGRTKAEAEKLVLNSGLPFLIIRPGLVIGDSLQGNKGAKDFLLSRVKKDKCTKLFTDEWRTPINAEDLVLETLNFMTSKATGIFHIAGTLKRNRYEIGKALTEKLGLSTKHIHPALRKDDQWASIRPENLSLATTRNFL